MTFFDTARAYSDSEEKIGEAFCGFTGRDGSPSRDKIYIATKSTATSPDQLKAGLETSLHNLRTDYIDIYQLHCVKQCYKPGDGTGLYETLQEAKAQGKIRHIGITAHKIGIAEEIAESGLYETLQFPFSYLASERDIALVEKMPEKKRWLHCNEGLIRRSPYKRRCLHGLYEPVPGSSNLGHSENERTRTVAGLFQRAACYDSGVRCHHKKRPR